MIRTTTIAILSLLILALSAEVFAGSVPGIREITPSAACIESIDETIVVKFNEADFGLVNAIDLDPETFLVLSFLRDGSKEEEVFVGGYTVRHDEDVKFVIPLKDNEQLTEEPGEYDLKITVATEHDARDYEIFIKAFTVEKCELALMEKCLNGSKKACDKLTR